MIYCYVIYYRFVIGVWFVHGDTPVVRASGRELSFVLLAGILTCYLLTFALVVRPTDALCALQRYTPFSVCIVSFKEFSFLIGFLQPGSA